MLSRSAAGLYWMGRYLERAGHLSRLLRQQTESLVDSPPRDIYFGWHRIYGALDREPLSGALEFDNDELFTLVDSFALTDDLTFEPTNPDSIRSCFAQGRENARQMRHHISAETAAQIDTFRGVTSSTLYRDNAWHFVQLGNYIERLQLSASLLMAQIAATRLFEVPADVYWTSLLRHYYAFEAYNRASSAAIEPDRVLGLLVTNPQLPDSLSLSVTELCGELTAVGPGPDAEATARTRSQAEYLRQLVGIEWPGGTGGHTLLRKVRDGCRQLHDLVTKTYFDYPVLAPVDGRAGRHDQ